MRRGRSGLAYESDFVVIAHLVRADHGNDIYVGSGKQQSSRSRRLLPHGSD
jgi:hypothetical protein